MKINVCYIVPQDIDIEVSDEFKKLEDDNFCREHAADWHALVVKLEKIIADRLPEDSEILGVTNADSHKIVYEN